MHSMIQPACGRKRPRGLAISRQRGFSLFIVLVVLLLSVLLALGGSRVAVLLEAMTGARREYDRAYEAAEAALVDAQRDIEGLVYSSTAKSYVSCDGVSEKASLCRRAPGVRSYPTVETSALVLDTCQDGICQFADPTSQRTASAPATKFWASDAYKNAGARYGQFTGAPAIAEGNDSLANARYWIELIVKPGDTFSERGKYLYRITAMSNGTRGSGATDASSVVLQMSFDVDPVNIKAPPPSCPAEPCPSAADAAVAPLSPPPPPPAPARG